jgi:hypothetical protein
LIALQFIGFILAIIRSIFVIIFFVFAEKLMMNSVRRHMRDRFLLNGSFENDRVRRFPLVTYENYKD